MKFAIIGSGYILLKHIEAIRHIKGEITEIINENSFINWKELVDNTKAKYIIILTPNYLHEEMAEYASRKGKTVLCEKPFAIKPFKKSYKNVFVVLQLRHHPMVKEMKKAIKRNNKIKLDIKVWRDHTYLNSWKTEDDKSGGIVFNLGIHYLDLVFWLAGDEGADIEYDLSIKSKKPHRTIIINGKSFNLSSKENLSEENLHRFVYQDLIKGKGVKPKELRELTKIIYENTNYRSR